MLACPSTHPNRLSTKDSLDEQRHETMSQHAPKQKFRPAPAKAYAVFQPGDDSFDPWKETENLDSHDQPLLRNITQPSHGISTFGKPMILKVGEDPNDPWNSFETFGESTYPNQQIPHFGHENGPKPPGLSTSDKPLPQTPVLVKVGEDPNDPWNTFEHFCGCTNPEHRMLQTDFQYSLFARADPRNAL